MSMTIVGPTLAFHASDDEHRKRMDATLKRGLETGQLTLRDDQLIREYLAERKATDQLSISRSSKILYHLVGWRHFIGPFTDNSILDIYQGIEKMKAHRDESGNPYKQNTQRDYLSILKKFLNWLIENEYSAIPLKKVEAIKNIPRDQMTVTSDDLLTEEEINLMLKAAPNSRDRALFAVQYDGALRAQEVGLLKWGDVMFSPWKATLNTKEKTGKPRNVPIVMALPYLAEWKADYPGTPSPDSFVFINNRGSNLTYTAITKIYRNMASRAGITKNVRPHIHRHTRITRYLEKGYSESMVKRLAWGNQSTLMINTYSHLTDADMDREIAEREGIRTDSVKPLSNILEPRQCGRCNAINGPIDNFCRHCGEPLTEDVVLEMDEVNREIHADPEYQEILASISERQTQLNK